MNAGYQTSNFTNGTVSIDHFVEMWKGDGTLADGTISQTVSQLSAGKYRLEADCIATRQFDASEVTGVSLFMGDEGTAIATANMLPQHFTVEFNNYVTHDVKIGLQIIGTNANWIAADNFRLYYLGSVDDDLADVSGENPLDMTSVIVNPSFTFNNAEGWEGSTPLFQTYNNAEFFQTTFDIHQSLSGLPSGNYLLKVRGLHRPGSNQDVYTAYKQGNTATKAELYANSESTTLAHHSSGARATQDLGDFAVTYNEQTQYVPNSMYEARRWFDAQEGYYEKELPVTVTDGMLTIGIRLNESTSYNWVIFDDFRLYYLGNVIRGDANGDGNVSVTDIAVVVNCILQLPNTGGFSEYGADANGDGSVTVTDIGVIVDKILGTNASSRKMEQVLEPQ